MISTLNVLILEDHQKWQAELRRALKEIEGPLRVDVADSLAGGLSLIDQHGYDLVTVDLELTDGENGLQLIDRLLNNPVNRDVALLVVTGKFTADRIYTVLRDYRDYDIIDKESYSSERLLAAARAALLGARLRRAARRDSERYRLTISFGREHWLGSDLHGARTGSYRAERPLPLDAADLTSRADRVNLLLFSGASTTWREEAKSVGKATFAALQMDRRIAADLDRARALSDARNPLRLELSGPSAGLGVPFELMFDGNEYLCLDTVLTRKLAQEELPLTRKTEPFSTFLADLSKKGEALRLLLVGANTDGKIPLAETEVSELVKEIGVEVRRLGLHSQVDVLSGTAATWETVRDRLRNGFYHIFHYAGHGRFADKLPEVSGLMLSHGESSRVLTAADLKLLVSGTSLRFVFLSCCLGARTAAHAGRGEFQGILEALARADVPAVLGYRWTVGDEVALELARCFYSALWKDLSPGLALLEARKFTSMGPLGRDGEAWASPILLSQSS
jgi:DNA-binding NarL/FixJ family response regulator